MVSEQQKEERSEAFEALKAENLHLLDELEMAYRQMEAVMVVGNRERRMAYDELRQRNEELQRRLAELGTSHAQLQETQRMLLRAERMSAMGQMAAAIVHEINGPLTVIAAQAEMLLITEREESRKAELQGIFDAALRLGDLAHNSLLFSRRRHIPPGLFDLNKKVRDVQRFFAPLTKEVEVEVAFDDQLPQVTASPSQVEQVLTNFMLNALDAMGELEEARLCIATGAAAPAALIAREEATGRRTCLALEAAPDFLQQTAAYVQVRDSGAGIAVDEMDEIFEAFFTTKDEEKGTGLGLAISRSIAADHQGNILVASKPGAGASFSLLLPLPATSYE